MSKEQILRDGSASLNIPQEYPELQLLDQGLPHVGGDAFSHLLEFILHLLRQGIRI